MKYAAKIAYDGSGFSGWQRQKGLSVRTVQEPLENALSLLDKRDVQVTVAGRTDRGVHALGQVVSFETHNEWVPSKLRNAMDANLPDTISILDVARVPSSFDARHSALWREYVYFIWKDHGCPPQIRPFVWKNTATWDFGVVREICDSIKGTHDFKAFCRLNDCPDDSRRTMISAGFSKRGPLCRIRIRGRSFLTNMMRIILGSIDLAASGKKDLSWFDSLLAGGSRVDAGPTAPSSGLFLWKVGYVHSPWKILEGDAFYRI